LPLVLPVHPTWRWLGSEAVSSEAYDDDARRMQRGVVRDARFENGKLAMDAWFELPSVDAETARSHQAVREGKPLGVSIGWMAVPIAREGEFEGDAYSAVHEEIAPHHVAVLLEEKGACSIGDGCGLPMAAIIAAARTPSYSGTEIVPWGTVKKNLRSFIAGYNKATDSNLDAGTSVGDLPTPAKRWIASKSLLGDPAANDFANLLFFPVVNPGTGKLNRGALLAVLGGRGAQAKIPATARLSARRIAERLNERHFRTQESQAASLTDGDLEDRINAVRRAVFEKFKPINDNDPWPMVRPVRDRDAVVEVGDKLFQIGWRLRTDGDEGARIVLGKEREVQRQFVPVNGSGSSEGSQQKPWYRRLVAAAKKIGGKGKMNEKQKAIETLAGCGEFDEGQLAQLDAIDDCVLTAISSKVKVDAASANEGAGKDKAGAGADADAKATGAKGDDPRATAAEATAALTEEQVLAALSIDRRAALDRLVNESAEDRSKLVAQAKANGFDDADLAGLTNSFQSDRMRMIIEITAITLHPVPMAFPRLSTSSFP